MRGSIGVASFAAIVNGMPAVAIAITLGVEGGGAQTLQESPVFRARSRLVEVSVVVKDANGNPVRDLKREDFEIYDNGRKQSIRLFRPEAYDRTSHPPKSAVVERREAEPQPLTFSNRHPAEIEAPNPPTVLVIDAANTWNIVRMTWPDLVYARDQVIRFLRQLRPDDRIGVYIATQRGFWIIREYDEPCGPLLERLDEWKGPGARREPNKFGDVWTEFAVRLGRIDEDAARKLHRAQFWDVDAIPRKMRGESLDALDTVTRHLEAVPGRKNIILVSGTLFLPSEPKEQMAVLRDIVARNVSVYTIDPGGLAPYALDGTFVVPSAVTAFRRPGDPPEDVLARRYADMKYAETRAINMYLHASLTALADATGGRVFVDTNDVMGGIQRSFEDSQVSYTIGYYPNNVRGDGEFHTIRVKTPGHGRLTVRHRNGYFEDRPSSTDPEQHYRDMEQLVWSPVDASAIELNAGVQRTSAEGTYVLDLRIGVASLAIGGNGDRTAARVEVLIVQRDLSGGEYEPSLQTLNLSLKRSTWEEALARGFEHRVPLTLHPKTFSVRVVVRDPQTGQAGTLIIPLEAFKRLQGGLIRNDGAVLARTSVELIRLRVVRDVR